METDASEFGGTVISTAVCTQESSNGGYCNDMTTVCFHHFWQEGFCGLEFGAKESIIDHLVIRNESNLSLLTQ